MSWLQRFVIAVLPHKWAESAKAESRNWIVSCSCGYERTFWDIGGIRWKATGREHRFLFCPHCGRRRWHTVYKKRLAAVL
jgi:hypothetical protein